MRLNILQQALRLSSMRLKKKNL